MKKLLSFAVAMILAFSAATTALAAPSAPASPDPAYNSLNIWIEDTALDLEEGDTATVFVSVSDNAYGFEYMKFYLVYPSCLTLKSIGAAGFVSSEEITSGVENTTVTASFRRAMAEEGLDADEVLGASGDGTYENKWTSVFIDCARTDTDAATGDETAVDCFDNGRVAAFEFRYDETLNGRDSDVLPLSLIAASDFLLHCENAEDGLGGKSYTAFSYGGEIELLGRLPDGSPYDAPTVKLSDATVGEGENSALFEASLYKNPGIVSATVFVIYDGAAKFASFGAGDVFTKTSFHSVPSEYAGSRDRSLKSFVQSDAALGAEIASRGIDPEGKLAAVIRIENDETDEDFMPVDETDNGILFSIALDTSALDGGEYEITLVCLGAVNKNGDEVAFYTVNGTLKVTDCVHASTERANETSPTCVRRGSYDVVCTACGKVLETVTVPALGHEYKEETAAPTCNDPGYTVFTCSRCGFTYTGDEAEPLGHDYVASTPVLPTCTEDGYVIYTCSRCGDGYRTEIPSSGHSFTAGETVAPTCGEPGYTLYVCQKCGETEKRDETGAIGHYYVRTVFSATCTDGGYTLYKCSRCGDSFVGEEEPALGHDHAETVIEATCLAGGYTYYSCKRCGSGYIDNEVLPLGHDYEEVTVGATCTESGCVAERCSRCGDKRILSEIGPLGHEYEESSVAATCTEGGYVAHVCSRCGDSYRTDETAALGHDKSQSYRYPVQPTKDADGLRTRTCPRCGEVIESKVIKYLLGDVDGDGKLNARDVSALKRYLAATLDYDEICCNCADMNGDGRHTSRDLSELKRLLTQ